MSKNKKQHTAPTKEVPTEEVQATPEAAETVATATVEEQPAPSKESKSADTFTYDKRKYKITAPRFILDMQEYSKELILKDEALQKQLAERIFYKDGVFLGEEEVESSILRIIY